MKRLIFLSGLLIYGSAFAQITKLVFGPLEGNNAGVLRTYENAAVDVDLWIRTEPGIKIVGFHIPLSSYDSVIQIDTLEESSLIDPLPWWDSKLFLSPNPDPMIEGYTNHSILALKDFSPGEDPDSIDAINTRGEWWKIMSFKMTAESPGQFDIPFCDAFVEGYHPDNGGLVLIDLEQGEMNRADYEVEFACLRFERFCGDYIMGDYNGNGSVNTSDILAAYSYLTTCSPSAAVMCQCPPGRGEEFPPSFDLNNSCTFNMADFYLFLQLSPHVPELAQPCEYCKPPIQ